MLHPFPHRPASCEPIVELIDVSSGYDGERVLNQVNLRIMPGDFVGFLGPAVLENPRCCALYWEPPIYTRVK